MIEAIVIGAGPCGISVAIELKRKGIEPLIIEKGCLVNTIYHFPLSMTFFSSPDKIELGEIPFTTIHDKPTRNEALTYYRTIVDRLGIQVCSYEKVEKITKKGDFFELDVTSKRGRKCYQAENVIVATGYYDQPRMLGIPGEELDHVYHYFREAHPFAGQRVAVIGGKNSAVDVALELQRVGAEVTMIYRKSSFSPRVKDWVRPLAEKAIEHGRIQMMWDTELVEIHPDHVRVKHKNEAEQNLLCEAVFAMTGYLPNLTLLQEAGAEINRDLHEPIYSESFETTVANLYVAGVILTGKDTGKVFIENGRHHGKKKLQRVLFKQKDSFTVRERSPFVLWQGNVKANRAFP